MTGAIFGGNGPSSATLGVFGNTRIHNWVGTSADRTSNVSMTTRPINNKAHILSCVDSGMLERSIVHILFCCDCGVLECSIAIPLSCTGTPWGYASIIWCIFCDSVALTLSECAAVPSGTSALRCDTPKHQSVAG